jgi:pyruvate/2-oxoglutarate dehydrogenase complex dihydrolipoamide dehydrogenase (E3) component
MASWPSIGSREDRTAKTLRYDLVIIGMGSGGLTAAQLAASIGVRVAVVERARIGGGRLWTGCVPSKALIASARTAHAMRHADRYGLAAHEPVIDLALVWDRVRGVQQSIAEAEHDADRFRAMGVDCIAGTAHLAGPHEVLVDGVRRLKTRFVLLCTGSRPAVPDVEGLTAAGYLTSETIWDLEQPPSSIALLGGGPVGVELAQAFARLGISTTLLQQGATLLPHDEPELVDALTGCLRDDGVAVRLLAGAERVTVDGDLKVLHGTEDGKPTNWRAAQVFVAVGRKPNVEGLALGQVGIDTTASGVTVDDRLRTSVPSVYAVGDVAGRHRFTHAAGHEAARAVRDMFLPGKSRATEMVPWCTFTDPELAHAGMTSAEAIERHGDDVEVHRRDLARSDRGRTDGVGSGSLVVVTAKERIVGAHVLAPAAGELIHELALAIRLGLELGDLAGMVHVYPTFATEVGRVAGGSASGRARRLRWMVRRRHR